jgi:hypothetical protein
MCVINADQIFEKYTEQRSIAVQWRNRVASNEA